MAEMEVARLKEALYDQYMIMTNLYDELEEEREFSATAASEALAMILRLEREKAAEKMEASQYKRMTEEKMQHVEENSAELEEEMQEKEMEISFLWHQLLEYHQKLSLIGVNVLDVEEEKSSFIRRNTSLPILRYSKLRRELEDIDLNRVDSYGTNGTNGTKDTKLEQKQTSCESLCAESVLPVFNKTRSSSSEVEVNATEVYDVFEVPESQGSCTNMIKEPKNKCVLSSTESLIIPEEDPFQGKEMKTLKKKKVNCSYKSTSSSSSKNDDLEEIKKRLERLEREKDVKQENVWRSEHQLELLKEIYQQLTTIEKRNKVVKSPKKCPQQDDIAYASVIEAILSFSI